MRIEVVSNCCDLEKLTIDFADKKKNKILFLSNIMYSKGIFHLIEAVGYLVSQGRDIELSIAGLPMADEFCGIEEIKDKFEKAIQGKDYIRYHGIVEGDLKLHLLSESYIFALPSFYKTEAQPISIIEAMKSGCVIVCNDHNYLADIVGNENGALITDELTKGLVENIAKYLDDMALGERVFNFNRVEAEVKYSPDLYLDKISRILNEV
nr:glycosyltransferase family 4 protein [Vibrio vulnificus]